MTRNNENGFHYNGNGNDNGNVNRIVEFPLAVIGFPSEHAQSPLPFDRQQQNEREVIAFLPDQGKQFGLLEIPPYYSDEFLVALRKFHDSLSKVSPDSSTAYLNHVEKQGEGYSMTIDQVIDPKSGLRLQVGPMGAFDAETVAAWTHTQTAAYDAKDTLGDAPTTRKNDMYEEEDPRKKTDEEVRVFERKLMSEMISGWKDSDVIACLSVRNGDGLTIIAGGSIKVGTTTRPLSKIMRHDNATISTFQALQINAEKVTELERTHPELLEAPEDAIACVSRLFNLSAIKGMEGRLEELGIENIQKSQILQLIIASLSTIGESNQSLRMAPPKFVFFDTHLRALHRFSVEVFGAETVATAAEMQLFPTFLRKDTVHAHHYKHWLNDRQSISVGFTPLDGYVARSNEIMRSSGISREQGKTPSIERHDEKFIFG